MRDKKKEYLYTKLKEERIFQGKVYFDFHFSQRYLLLSVLNEVPFSNDSLIYLVPPLRFVFPFPPV